MGTASPLRTTPAKSRMAGSPTTMSVRFLIRRAALSQGISMTHGAIRSPLPMQAAKPLLMQTTSQISTPSATAATTTMQKPSYTTCSRGIMNLNMKEIGKRISDRRKKLGIKQNILAEKLDISNNHMSGIENGKATPSVALFVMNLM